MSTGTTLWLQVATYVGSIVGGAGVVGLGVYAGAELFTVVPDMVLHSFTAAAGVVLHLFTAAPGVVLHSQLQAVPDVLSGVKID